MKDKIEAADVHETDIELPEISAADLTQSIFNSNYDFLQLNNCKKDDFGALPHFSPVDVNRYNITSNTLQCASKC